MKIKVKTISGGSYDVELEQEDPTVLNLKETVAPMAKSEPANLKIVFRGKILKDDQTLSSCGIEDAMAVHMVVRKAKAPAVPTAAPAAAPAAPPAGEAGVAPDPTSATFENPMMQSMLGNRDLMRSLMQSHPDMRRMLETRPEMAEQLLDPINLQRAMRAAMDPAYKAEMMQSADQAMQRLMSHEGGEAALQRFWRESMGPRYADEADAAKGRDETVGSAPASHEEAVRRAAEARRHAEEDRAGPVRAEALPNPWGRPSAPAGGMGMGMGMGMGGFNPFAAMGAGGMYGGGMGAGAGGAAPAGAGSAGSGSDAAAPAPAPAAGAPAGNPFAAMMAGMGGGGMPGMGGAGMPGMDGAGMPGMGGGMPGMGGGMPGMGGAGMPPGGLAGAAAMLENPAMREMMVNMMSSPGFVDNMARMNPMLGQMMQSNPAMREMLSNPETIRRMLSPEMMRMAAGMAGGAGGMGGMGGMGGAPGMNPMMAAMMGGMGGGMPGMPGAPAPAPAPAAGAPGGMDPFMAAMMGGGGLPGMGMPPAATAPAPAPAPAPAGAGAPAASPAPAPAPAPAAPAVDDSVRFSAQLQQMRDLGFTDDARNIEALRATHGNVQFAINRLLG